MGTGKGRKYSVCVCASINASNVTLLPPYDLRGVVGKAKTKRVIRHERRE